MSENTKKIPSGDLAMSLERMRDLEAIRQLKARYFRGMDTKDWALFATVFAEDAAIDVTEDAGDAGRVRGREAIVASISGAVGEARTVHHGHMPEIRFTGPDEANGIWAMTDYVEFAAAGAPSGLRGYGHYHERYRRVDGEWKIASMKLTRLRRDPLSGGAGGV